MRRENALSYARRLLLLTVLRAVVACLSPVYQGPSLQAAASDTFTLFETRIRPVLIDRCYPCHSAQAERVKGAFRLDTRAGLLKGGESGQPAVLPGNAQASRLVRAIRYTDPDFQMPPKARLTEEQVADFVQWINEGALEPESNKPDLASGQRPSAPLRHWAFQPVRKPKVPRTQDQIWPTSIIDRFVLAQLEEKGLKPVGDADRTALIRRASFDLVGLPPSPEEVADFVGDVSPDAFGNVVERLLASPAYGERWGRHWMDVVRYADTAGDNADYPIPEARLYRDYIIASFNADKPYDVFVREQLAGDILAKRDGNSSGPLIATGFLALSRRYATAPFELWHLTVEDAIETTGRAFMGLTLRCARCHDHKYDPVTREDYYALYGFFASTRFPYAGSEEFVTKGFPRTGFVPLVTAEKAQPLLDEYHKSIEKLRHGVSQMEQEDPLGKELAGLTNRIAAQRIEIEATVNAEGIAALRLALAELEKRRDTLRAQLQQKLKPLKDQLINLLHPGLPSGLPGAYAVSEGDPTDEPIHLRGEPDQKGPIIKRRVPSFLAGDAPLVIPAGTSGRLELAEWLTGKDHPLTARVMVNRIWQHHFGRGIVATPSNFGVRGEPPTHPELLDYLTLQFIESGWSVKALHRLIMGSRTYQLASADSQSNSAQDPDNQLLWRANRRRLDAEAIRDALLSAAGQLDLRPSGEHPFPAIDSWKFTQHAPFKAVYPSHHRSVYLMTQRIQRHPFLALFDAPDANTTADLRTESTVPMQALFLLNNEFVHEQAKALAARLLAQSSDPRECIRKGVELLWARAPTEDEIDRAVNYLEEFQRRLAAEGAPPERATMDAWNSYAHILLSANEFLFID